MPASSVKTLGAGWLSLLFVLVVAPSSFADQGDLDTQLMLSTVKLTDSDSTGTAFILSRPSPGDPKATQFLLITAEHTLARSKANEVTVVFRKTTPEGDPIKAPVRVPVRQDGKPLWKKHPNADVGILPITPPPGIAVPAVSVDLLATDEDLAKHEIHPGDSVRCVGFPHPNQFEPSDAGFGVVRSGCIAGYPIRPTKKTRTLLLDLNAFEGDSGAPVYLVDEHRYVAGKAAPGPVRLILGMMVGQHFLDEEYKMIYQTGRSRHRMGLAIAVHATTIKEAIALLDARPGPG